VYRNILELIAPGENETNKTNANISDPNESDENESKSDSVSAAAAAGPVHTGAAPVMEMSESQIELDPVGSGSHQRTSSSQV
jgi:hypothetical protein